MVVLTEGTYDKLKIHPSHLMRMVVEGQAEIVGRDAFGRRIYRLLETNPTETHPPSES